MSAVILSVCQSCGSLLVPPPTLLAQRDALAEALRDANDALEKEWGSTSELCFPDTIERAIAKARAALALLEEGK